jgi:hypothetical protein
MGGTIVTLARCQRTFFGEPTASAVRVHSLQSATAYISNVAVPNTRATGGKADHTT